MATIKDVAERAGVAPSTISKFLNGGTVRAKNAEAIREAIAALDYRVNPFARNLKTQRSHSVGVLLPDVTAPFYGAVLQALDRVLRANGYHSLISCYDSNYGLEHDNLQFLIGTGIDGLIYVPENLAVEEFQELTENTGVPVVMVDRMLPGAHADAVLTDNSESVFRAISLLFQQGHRRIGIISGPRSVSTARERLAGYLRALKDNGVFYDDTLAVSGENAFATGYQGLITLMGLENPPTAIFSTNYDITLGLITAARERDVRIPEQVSIFGYDCVEVCSMMTPTLPVVHQDEQELGRLAASYLIERIEGSEVPPRLTRLRSQLVL